MSNVVALPTRSLQLSLCVTDPEVLHELERREEGTVRETFAAHALRLGVLALRQASGSLDADVIRREGDQLMSAVSTVLKQQTSELSNALVKTMVQYFDPASGALPQRLDQLTRPQGELETLLAKHLSGDQSVIAQTLARQIGESSPIFKLLSPTQSDGLIATLSSTIKNALAAQRDEVLKQFSLDHRESALSRLLAEVMTSNGKLRSELAEDVGKVVQEFSLDNENGALSRLVARVEEAQATISEELSLDFEGSSLQRLSSLLEKTSEAVETSLTLDDDGSPLARLRREILDVLTQHKLANSQFQSEVRSTLETFKTRREEAARTTLHGLAFEDSMGEFIAREAARLGDVCESVGTTQGREQRKHGDYVVELGPESASPGARIVFEAKAKKRYTIKSALQELADARKNRDAQVGVFVFDRASAPPAMEKLHRVGCDLLVVWDADEPATDIYLSVALGVARTLAHRECVASEEAEADFATLDAAIDSLAQQLDALSAIEKSARTVKKNGDSILASAQAVRDVLERNLADLRNYVQLARGEARAAGA